MAKLKEKKISCIPQQTISIYYLTKNTFVVPLCEAQDFLLGILARLKVGTQKPENRLSFICFLSLFNKVISQHNSHRLIILAHVTRYYSHFTGPSRQ